MDREKSCTIGLGSNTDDRKYQIERAIEHLCGYFDKCTVSSVYELEAFNGKDKPYLNTVMHGQTRHDYESVIRFLKKWEAECGRTQTESVEGIISIDLDLVIWDGQIKRPRDFERIYFNKGYRELLAQGAYEII